MRNERKPSGYRDPLIAVDKKASLSLNGEERARREQLDAGRSFFRLANDILIKHGTISDSSDFMHTQTLPIEILTGRGNVTASIEGEFFPSLAFKKTSLNLQYTDGDDTNKSTLTVVFGEDESLGAQLPPTERLKKGINVLYLLLDRYREQELSGARLRARNLQMELDHLLRRENVFLPSVDS